MISVEFIPGEEPRTRKRLFFFREHLPEKPPAVRINFSAEHYINVNEVMPLFHWTDNDVFAQEIGFGRIIFTHYLEAAAIWERKSLSSGVGHDITVHPKSTLTLVPLEAYVPVDSLIDNVIRYINVKNPRSSITPQDIKGIELLKKEADRLYPDRK